MYALKRQNQYALHFFKVGGIKIRGYCKFLSYNLGISYVKYLQCHLFKGVQWPSGRDTPEWYGMVARGNGMVGV